MLLAGTFEPFDAERALEVGYSSLLVKPFETGKLVDLVKKLVSRAVTVKVAQSVDEDASDFSEAEETPGSEPIDSPRPIRFPVPTAEGKILFELSPRQCRLEGMEAKSTTTVAELSSQQVDDLVEEVIARLSETLRTLVPQIAREVLDTPVSESVKDSDGS